MTRYQVLVWVPIMAVAVLAFLVLRRVVTPDDASKYLTIGAAAVSTAFLLVYSLLGHWWRTVEGRTIVALMAVIAGTTCYVVTVLVWGPYLGRDLVRFVTWSGVFLACSRITVLLVQLQMQGRAARAVSRSHRIRGD